MNEDRPKDLCALIFGTLTWRRVERRKRGRESYEIEVKIKIPSLMSRKVKRRRWATKKHCI